MDLIFINVAEKAIVPVAVVVALLVIQTRGTVAKAGKNMLPLKYDSRNGVGVYTKGGTCW